MENQSVRSNFSGASEKQSIKNQSGDNCQHITFIEHILLARHFMELSKYLIVQFSYQPSEMY